MGKKHRKRRLEQRVQVPTQKAQPRIELAAQPVVDVKPSRMFWLLAMTIAVPILEVIIIQMYVIISIFAHYGWRDANNWGLMAWLKGSGLIYEEAMSPMMFIPLFTFVLMVGVSSVAYLRMAHESH